MYEHEYVLYMRVIGIPNVLTAFPGSLFHSNLALPKPTGQCAHMPVPLTPLPTCIQGLCSFEIHYVFGPFYNIIKPTTSL